MCPLNLFVPEWVFGSIYKKPIVWGMKAVGFMYSRYFLEPILGFVGPTQLFPVRARR